MRPHCQVAVSISVGSVTVSVGGKLSTAVEFDTAALPTGGPPPTLFGLSATYMAWKPALAGGDVVIIEGVGLSDECVAVLSNDLGDSTITPSLCSENRIEVCSLCLAGHGV